MSSMMSRARVLCSAFVATVVLACALAGCQSNADKEKSDATNHQGSNYQARAEAADEAFAEGAKKPAKPRTFYSLAKVLAAQGRDREAATVLTTLIERHPKFIPAYNALAEIHMRADSPEEAAAVLSKGLRHRPNDPVLVNNLGMVYVVQGHYQQALEQFEHALAAKPKEPGLLANKAMALGMLGRTDEAAAIYGQIMTPAEARDNLRILAKARGDSAGDDDDKDSEAAETEAEVETQPKTKPLEATTAVITPPPPVQ